MRKREMILNDAILFYRVYSAFKSCGNELTFTIEFNN